MQSPEQITEGGLWNGRLLAFESLPSTNQWVLDNVRDCRHGDIVLARSQTDGRGRFDRSWCAVPDRSLTLSAVLMPSSPGKPIPPSVCQAAAVAVRRTLSEHGIEGELKWPNDVVVAGRKTAGILAETEPDTGTVALGIGLNVNMTGEDFEGRDLLQPATSMMIETGSAFDLPVVRAILVAQLETALDIAEDSMALLLEQWARADFLSGKRINVLGPGGTVAGAYAGLDSDGRLLLVDDAGTTHTFQTGDVSVRT